MKVFLSKRVKIVQQKSKKNVEPHMFRENIVIKMSLQISIENLCLAIYCSQAVE